ncbi:MAG: hypothetical protein ACTSXH_02010 [Promethearchaeota archaeon]
MGLFTEIEVHDFLHEIICIYPFNFKDHEPQACYTLFFIPLKGNALEDKYRKIKEKRSKNCYKKWRSRVKKKFSF